MSSNLLDIEVLQVLQQSFIYLFEKYSETLLGNYKYNIESNIAKVLLNVNTSEVYLLWSFILIFSIADFLHVLYWQVQVQELFQ